jgi:hypothetical protein
LVWTNCRQNIDSHQILTYKLLRSAARVSSLGLSHFASKDNSMPSAISTQSITFANNHVAQAISASSNADVAEVVKALKLHKTRSVFLLLGGAGGVADELKPRLIQLFGRGIARAVIGVNAVVIDGGTKAGVMEMMGQGVADRGFKTALIGVAPGELVTYPGGNGAGNVMLDANHSHFVLVEGKEWGSETGTLFKLVNELKGSSPIVAMIVAGGEVTRNEALQAVRQNIPLIVVQGSGGVADEIATAWRAGPELPEDPLMAEIIADGNIELHQLSNSVRSAERLVVRALGGDNVLLQAWERFADYDLNATLQQKRFQKLQLLILAIGVIATALALVNEVWDGNNKRASLKDWWYSPAGTFPANRMMWAAVYYVLILLPIILTVMITAANRFKQGNKWLLLRAGAESIKREIYRYRARAGDYVELLFDATTAQPRPTPEQVLAQRVEDVTRRVMRTEVNSTSLIPYDKGKGFPPYMYAAEGGDDGFSMLAPDRYVEVRLGDQLNYFRRKTVKLEKRLKVIQWTIFVLGGLGTLLAAIQLQVWIALTTAIGAALATFLSYQQTENTLMKYNQAATDLDNVKSWWTALPAEEQARPETVTTLVDHTEKVLESELDGWVQQMQNALAELRKGQAQASEKESGTGGPSGGGSGGEGSGGDDSGGDPADAVAGSDAGNGDASAAESTEAGTGAEVAETDSTDATDAEADATTTDAVTDSEAATAEDAAASDTEPEPETLEAGEPEADATAEPEIPETEVESEEPAQPGEG